jgi:glycosyltransferase involved in cell wall biosynthesis
LYVGRIVAHKGVHTAVEALRLLADQYPALTLTIVGESEPTSYATELREQVCASGLESRIRFEEFIDRTELPNIYRSHDMLLFPSIWDEPFGITLLEAMSSGLPAIGTGTGGSGEIIQDGVNGLIFPKEDAAACAAQIARLLEDRDLFETLREGGRRSVEESFDLDRAIDKVENCLLTIGS